MTKLTKRIIAFACSLAMTTSLFGTSIYAAGEEIEGWTLTIMNGTEGTIGSDNVDYVSGGTSLKVVNLTPASSNKYIMATANVSLVEGREYYIGAYVKSLNSSSVQFVIDWDTRYSTTGYGNTFDWRNYEFVYTAKKTGTAVFRILVEGVSDGAWFDDARFIDAETGENLLSNPGFDLSANTSILPTGDLEEKYYNILKQESYSEEDAVQVRGAFKYMPVYTADEIKVDGSGDDWSEYPAMTMPTLPSQYNILVKTDKPVDLKAESKFAFDSENFYLYIKVYDDIHQYVPGADNYWRGDSAQVTISELDEGYGSEVGFAYNPDTNEGEIYGSGFTSEDMEKITLSAARDGEYTVYEAAIPWTLKFESVPEKILFDFLVNDADGDGRKYCIELAPGIAKNKVNTEFPTLELVDSKNDWYSWIQAPKTGFTGEEVHYDFFLINGGEAKTFTIKNAATGESEEINVPAHSGIRRGKTVVFDTDGEQEILIEALAGEEGFTAGAKVNVSKRQPTKEYTQKVIDTIALWADELENLISKCEDKGITTDYETITYRILKIFAQDMVTDMANNDFARVYYIEENTAKLFEEAKTALLSYLVGEASPKAVPRFVTSDMEIQGQSIMATTQYKGIEDKRPVFFVGYGHSPRALSDIPILTEVGANAFQMGVRRIPLTDTGKGENGHQYEFNPTSTFVTELTDALEVAEENNISVDLLIGPHQLAPEVISDLEIGVTQTGFFKYNINAEPAKVVMETYLRGFIPMIKNYKSLRSIILSNEPQLDVAACGDFYLEDWQEYLKERYGTIEALNVSYETEYTTFDEVDLVADKTMPAKNYDVKTFTNIALSEWHKWVADLIRELAPGIPLHSKIMGHTSDWDLELNKNGTDYEYYTDFEINGSDYANYLIEAGNEWDHDYLTKNMWYDFMCSLKDVTVANTEDHVIPDGSVVYIPEIADYVAQDIYQGAIHGRGISEIWTWNREYDVNSVHYASLLERPDVIAAVGKQILDLNRLSYEITALQKEPMEVGILYSNPSVLNDNTYMPSVYMAYKAYVMNGKRPKFIVDSQLDKMQDMKMVIVPSAKIITSESLEALKSYIDNGGKVLIMGKGLFGKNERNLDNDTTLIDYIYANSHSIEYTVGRTTNTASVSETELRDIVKAELINAKALYFTVIDAETDEQVYDVEASMGVNRGDVILNLLNYSDAKNVKVMLGDSIVAEMYDLTNEEEVGDTVTLEKYIPKTFKIDWNNKFFDTFGHWAEDNIVPLARSGIINGMSESRFAPDAQLTRAQFLTLLVKAAGYETEKYTQNVPDVDKDAWYAEVVAMGVQNGVISANEVFRPDDKITREEMCTMLVKCYEGKRGVISGYSEANFDDIDLAKDKESIRKAASLNLMYGYEDGSFAPKNGATRAEAASVIARFIGQ